MVGILSVFAQLEREQIKERTQMGRIERAKEGLWKGGGAVPVGYEYYPQTNDLRLNEYEALQVREIFDMFVNRHYAYNRICKEMCKKDIATRTAAGNMLQRSRLSSPIPFIPEESCGKANPIKASIRQLSRKKSLRPRRSEKRTLHQVRARHSKQRSF